MTYIVDMMTDRMCFKSDIELVMSEIQALCDVTHIVNVISYRVDDMSYIVHVMSPIRGM